MCRDCNGVSLCACFHPATQLYGVGPTRWGPTRWGPRGGGPEMQNPNSFPSSGSPNNYGRLVYH